MVILKKYNKKHIDSIKYKIYSIIEGWRCDMDDSNKKRIKISNWGDGLL
jgi:hypothetical protein